MPTFFCGTLTNGKLVSVASGFCSGVARGLLQGRPLQLSMGWGVGKQLAKRCPTFEQLCGQNLAWTMSYCFSSIGQGSLDRIGKKCAQKMSENCVFSPSPGNFSDIFFDTLGHLVDIPPFWAVQRSARNKVTVWGWNGSSGSGFRFKEGFCVFQYSLVERTVPVPVSVPGKRFRRFRFRVRFLGKRFRRFRFLVPVRFLGHPVFLIPRVHTKSGWLEVDQESDMGCQLLARTFRFEIAGVFLAVVLWQHPICSLSQAGVNGDTSSRKAPKECSPKLGHSTRKFLARGNILRSFVLRRCLGTSLEKLLPLKLP